MPCFCYEYNHAIPYFVEITASRHLKERMTFRLIKVDILWPSIVVGFPFVMFIVGLNGVISVRDGEVFPTFIII
jgi:hypothetical protein